MKLKNVESLAWKS